MRKKENLNSEMVFAVDRRMSGNLEPGVHINSKKQTSQNPTKTTNK
jgi:hypothetical protein